MYTCIITLKNFSLKFEVSFYSVLKRKYSNEIPSAIKSAKKVQKFREITFNTKKTPIALFA